MPFRIFLFNKENGFNFLPKVAENSFANKTGHEKGKELTSHSRKSKCTVVEDSTKSGLAFSTHVVHVPKKREGQDKANPIVLLFQFFRSTDKLSNETSSPCRDISYNRNGSNETSGYDLGGWAILGNQSLEKTIGNRAGEWDVHVTCSQY